MSNYEPISVFFSALGCLRAYAQHVHVSNLAYVYTSYAQHVHVSNLAYVYTAYAQHVHVGNLAYVYTSSSGTY